MLVNCVAYTQGKKFADIPVAEISEQIKKPDTFVWVAFKDPTSEELAQIQEEFDLHGGGGVEEDHGEVDRWIGHSFRFWRRRSPPV